MVQVPKTLGTLMEHIWIDGGCNPNPGVGTIGVYCKNKFRCGLKVADATTNNRMEYVSLYAAIMLSRKFNFDSIDIRTDSKIVAATFNNRRFVGKGNQTLASIRQAFMQAAEKFGSKNIRVAWVPREENLVADELATMAYTEDVWDGMMGANKESFISLLQSKVNPVPDLPKKSKTINGSDFRFPGEIL